MPTFLKLWTAGGVLAAHCVIAAAADSPASASQSGEVQECFLLWEIGVGERRRNPAEACPMRVAPASTFKIPHALAALDAGVISGIDEKIAYDGATSREVWRRDHTLQSAMHHSVLWYFQRVAERLGQDRETEYLRRFKYGNEDASSGLTTFWLGQSLLITADEQQSFLRNLYEGKLPASKAAVDAVKQILIQPRGVVVNAVGQHAFNAPWPADATVSAKTGSANDRNGRGVRWLVGHVQRGQRAFVFVSCVVGSREVGANVAIDLAARSLREEAVL